MLALGKEGAIKIRSWREKTEDKKWDKEQMEKSKRGTMGTNARSRS